MATLITSVDLGADFFGPSRFKDYLWILVLDVFFAFAAAFCIGANDVATSFGPSVGSRTLTMRQAIGLASVFEFTGAFFLGAQTTKTIAGGIAKESAFTRDPELLMYGMMCVDLGVATWLWIATYLSMPTSCTHSVVAAVVGMTLVLKGADAVYWHSTSSSFPYIGGVSSITIAWIASPILAGIGAAIMFFAIRTFCLRSKDPLGRSLLALPLVVLIAVSVNLMFLIKKGGKNQGGQDISWSIVQGVAWGTGGLIAIIVAACLPWLKRRIVARRQAREEAAAKEVPEVVAKDVDDGEDDGKADKSSDSGSDPQPARLVPFLSNPTWKNFLANTIDRDIHCEGCAVQAVRSIHENAEVFDEDAESAFKYLQVLTACCNSLAHGANEVANAIGPLAAIAHIYKTSNFSADSHVERWVLFVGAFGIVVGLATYSYNCMRTIGLSLARITASRGFCIELATAMTVLVAASYGLPVSTTPCVVGATTGVGLFEGFRGVNWMLFAKMYGTWIITIFMAAAITAVYVAIGVHAPSIKMAHDIEAYEDGLRVRQNAYIWGLQWEAHMNSLDPSSVKPVNLTADGFTARVVPDYDPAVGVPADKFYRAWNHELVEGYKEFSEDVAWFEAWEQASENTSTWEPTGKPSVFQMFDRLTEIAFSPNQAKQIQQVVNGEKKICCEETYKCCPRRCVYEKVDPDCESKCVYYKEDPTCVEKGCGGGEGEGEGSDPDKYLVETKAQMADFCKLIDPDEECPMYMSDTNPRNYVSAAYINTPQANTTLYVPQEAVDWREDDIDLSLRLCPVAVELEGKTVDAGPQFIYGG